MQEFVNGTEESFRMLEQSLSEGKIYKFANRNLPDCCTPKTACLWFGKTGDFYRVCIDKGITTREGNEEFRKFLMYGGASFSNMNSMIDFLHSLKPLFSEGTTNSRVSVELNDHISKMMDRAINISNSESHIDGKVVDRGRLKAIRTQGNMPEQVWPEEIAERLKRKIYGQDAVIDEIAEHIVINKMRVDKKLLTMMFLGPTATGKSETAKSIAEVMSTVYGKKYGYIEIAGSEFVNRHAVHRFLGAPPGYIGYGDKTVLDSVRRNPYHVIVINEIEKAHESLLVGLMEAIDTGFLGMTDNTPPINLNNCVLILTSNMQINMSEYEEATPIERAELCRDTFTRFCGRPEISGKIGNFLVFQSLSDEAVTSIIIKFISEELDSYELKLAHIDEYLMADFLGIRTKYGARGIRGIVDEVVGKYLLKNRHLSELKGKQVLLKGRLDSILIEALKEDEL